jgi:hypothetical protein
MEAVAEITIEASKIQARSFIEQEFISRILCIVG